MKVEVLQENIVKALADVSRFVANKPSLPILSTILIKAEEGKLGLMATNMDTGVKVEVPAKIIEEGRVAVPAKLMYEYVNLLSVGKLELGILENSLQLKTKERVAKVSIADAAEFPEMPEFDGEKKCEVKKKDWEKIVRLVKFSASTDPARPVLSALLFDFSRKKGLRVVATDGYRLSLLDKLNVKENLGVEKVLVHSGVVEEIGRLVKDLDVEYIELKYSEKQKSLAFLLDNTWVVTRLVEGDFPPYERILPKDSEIVIKIDRLETLTAIKAASVFARDGAHIVGWEINKKNLKVFASAANVGEQESFVDVEKIKEGLGKISFNSRFLSDFLGSVTDDLVEFGMTGELQPGLFSCGEEGFVHVIMPVRTQSRS